MVTTARTTTRSKSRQWRKFCRGVLVFVVGLVPPVSTIISAEDPQRKAFFDKEVEPILVGHCLHCHGRDREGGLDLRSRPTLLEGGESGAVVVPNKPDDSLLLEYVAEGEMPPDKPLGKHEVEVLRRWIRDGAWFPDEPIDLFRKSTGDRAGYDWWSLRPIRAVVPPRVGGRGRELNPIDCFILARLQAKGLELAPPADRATYIRRVTYDLTGLSPTPEEVERFVADRRSGAYERLVDRLLASPHYGERWGRYWLDIVRFAESNGFERDRIRRNFWPYRDYVIRSFNDDKPYDQFVIEQLAGDALAPDDPQRRIALGFLAAGPKNDVATISELEQLKTRQDELDEFVVATGTTFLGLTVGCARCHDHKYDPIPSTDYYALTAVFTGCRHDADVTIATPEERRIHEGKIAPLRSELDKKRTDRKRMIEEAKKAFIAARIAAENSRQREANHPPRLPPVNARSNEDSFAAVKAKYLRFVITRSSSAQPCLDELEVYGPNDDRNAALASEGAVASASSLLPGYEIHQINHLNDGKHGNAHSWISKEPSGWAQIEFPAVTEIDRVVWGRDREGRYTDRVPIGYRIEVSLDGRSWSVVSDSTRRDPFQSAPPGKKITDQQVIASLSDKRRKQLEALEREIESLERRLESIPPLPTTYSIRDENGLLEVPVLKRGDVRSRGENVSAGALSAIRQLDPSLVADSGPARRLKLAQWITDAANPLTARVMVNRIWQNHFGTGIVDTPSDFGFKGGRPSHPELLDWLAHDFMEHGWQLKRIHRRIVLSATYRQSSRYNPRASTVDAGNRLLWRYAPRRLDSEAVRDILLQLSGKLDRRLGGPSFELFVYRDGNVPDYRLIERPGPKTWRRSVYRYNIRTFRNPLFAAFDCPDPSVSTPTRLRSTTPLQALSLLNNSFVIEQTRFMAERVRREVPEDLPARVTAAYRLVLLRSPTEDERDRAVAFARRFGLAGLFRVLVNSNEFLYVF